MSMPAEESTVLLRAREFLPQIERANKELSDAMLTRPPEAFDIEVLENDENDHVELELACGILELKDDATCNAAEMAVKIGGCLQTEPDYSSDSQDAHTDDEKREGEVRQQPLCNELSSTRPEQENNKFGGIQEIETQD